MGSVHLSQLATRGRADGEADPGRPPPGRRDGGWLRGGPGMSVASNKADVGEVRPSQVMTTFGVGSIIDLPYLSIMVMGLDDWQTLHAAEVADERLLLSVQESLGQQVKKLNTPPRPPESTSFNPSRTPPRRHAVARSPAGCSAPLPSACSPKCRPVRVQGRPLPARPGTLRSCQLPYAGQAAGGHPGPLRGGLPARAPERLPVGLVRPPR